MNLNDFQVEIARSYSESIQPRPFCSAGFFMSAKASVPFSQAEDMAELLYGLCRATVRNDIEARCMELGIPVPDGPPIDMEPRGDSSDRAFQEKARELNAAKHEEENPFTVTAELPIPPEPTAKKRGRPAKAAAAATEPEPPRQSAVPIQAEPELSNVGQEPEPEEIPEGEALRRAVDTLSKGAERETPTWNAPKAKMLKFIKSFLGTETLPPAQKELKDPQTPAIQMVLPVLQSMIRLYPGGILSEPEKYGIESGAGYHKLVRYIDKWPDAAKDIAKDAAITQYPDNPYDLVEFLDSGAKMDLPDTLVFLLLVKRDKALAGKVRETASAQAVPIVDLMRGLDLARCEAGEILGRLVGKGAAA